MKFRFVGPTLETTSETAESREGGNREEGAQVGQVTRRRPRETERVRGRGRKGARKKEKKPLNPSSSGSRYVTLLESWHCVTKCCQDEWRRKGISCCERAYLLAGLHFHQSAPRKRTPVAKWINLWQVGRFLISVNCHQTGDPSRRIDRLREENDCSYLHI